MRQTSRRSWRPGQRLPVEVPHLAYKGTMQAQLLALVAAKLRSALVVKGELPEDGLAALDGDSHERVVALARRLVAEDSALDVDGHSLEALFAAARREEQEGDAYLVSGRWDEEGGLPDEDVSGAALRAVAGLPGASGAGAWQQPLALDVLPALASDDSCVDTGSATSGRVISFDELARLAVRPRRRQRTVPAGQLTLLSA